MFTQDFFSFFFSGPQPACSFHGRLQTVHVKKALPLAVTLREPWKGSVNLRCSSYPFLLSRWQLTRADGIGRVYRTLS